MCQLMSGLITKEKTYYDLDSDSHEDLIKKAGVVDDGNSPDFVRVEMIPKDGNIFNHDIKNWVLKVDQDFRPKWFSEKFAEAEMKKAIKELWAERFVLGRTIKEIKNGRWFVGNGGTVQKVLGGTVQKVLGGTVQEVWGGGTVQEVLGGTVQEVLDGGTVQEVLGGTVIIYDGSFKEIKGSGIVIMRNKNRIITAQDFKLEIKKDVPKGEKNENL